MSFIAKKKYLIATICLKREQCQSKDNEITYQIQIIDLSQNKISNLKKDFQSQKQYVYKVWQFTKQTLEEINIRVLRIIKIKNKIEESEMDTKRCSNTIGCTLIFQEQLYEKNILIINLNIICEQELQKISFQRNIFEKQLQKYNQQNQSYKKYLVYTDQFIKQLSFSKSLQLQKIKKNLLIQKKSHTNDKELQQEQRISLEKKLIKSKINFILKTKNNYSVNLSQTIENNINNSLKQRIYRPTILNKLTESFIQQQSPFPFFRKQKKYCSFIRKQYHDLQKSQIKYNLEQKLNILRQKRKKKAFSCSKDLLFENKYQENNEQIKLESIDNLKQETTKQQQNECVVNFKINEIKVNLFKSVSKPGRLVNIKLGDNQFKTNVIIPVSNKFQWFCIEYKKQRINTSSQLNCQVVICDQINQQIFASTTLKIKSLLQAKKQKIIKLYLMHQNIFVGSLQLHFQIIALPSFFISNKNALTQEVQQNSVKQINTPKLPSPNLYRLYNKKVQERLNNFNSKCKTQEATHIQFRSRFINNKKKFPVQLKMQAKQQKHIIGRRQCLCSITKKKNKKYRK